MIPPPIPENEAKRLQALYRTRLLDSISDDVLQRLARCVAQMTGAPIALISLVDRDRQWFLCRVGLDVTETPRDVSFCGHAVASAAPLVVDNVFDDPRFFNNPLVVGPPYVRAYLGVPLLNREGLALGTLCAIDTEPRHWTDAEKAVVAELAVVAVALIAARAAKFDLHELVETMAPRKVPEVQPSL